MLDRLKVRLPITCIYLIEVSQVSKGTCSFFGSNSGSDYIRARGRALLFFNNDAAFHVKSCCKSRLLYYSTEVLCMCPAAHMEIY